MRRLADSQGEFQARHKGVFDAVSDVPVTTGAQARTRVVLVGCAQRHQGLGIAPAVDLGVAGLCADAGEFRESAQQFGLDARCIVFEVFL